MARAARGARAIGLLAVAFALAAALFDSEPLWVPAATLALLAAGSAAWVGLGAGGVRITRSLGARHVMEDEPMAIVLDVSAGRLGLPPAHVADPLLPAAVALRTGARGGRVRIEARFGRRGRRPLVLPRVLVGDPLGLVTREVSARPSATGDELLVLPRIEPVVAAPGGGDADRAPWAARRRRRERAGRDSPAARRHARVTDLLARGGARRRRPGALSRDGEREPPAGRARSARQRR